MPRLPSRLLRQARQHSPNLAALVPACRDIQSAQNELRWLTEYVTQTINTQSIVSKDQRLRSLCQRRRRGVPLQYILGSQPFGPLDIKCRSGVLIPRPETEAYTYHLVDLIKSGKLLPSRSSNDDDELSIVDLCTGTGCIPLLLYALLQPSFSRLRVRGVDISSQAISLAKLNIDHNTKLGNISVSQPDQTLNFLRGDIFKDQDVAPLTRNPCDILVSNPPYVSRKAWDLAQGRLSYSVRKYEPRLALVPHVDAPVPAGWQHEDVFYSRLLDLAMLLKPRVALLELGEEPQARRVLGCLFRHKIAKFVAVEVWRDWPDLTAADGEAGALVVEADDTSRRVLVKGSGEVRSILLRLRWDT
ncbi:Modification methylase HemK [Metarhizium album ARSEF 1941]|uniref:Modification methylase HemK n=1 Tax=Metarhizium album (strain ARSEF 1941) TaxID=1081103 RepID=A0A0B2WYZ5_METAS|nr:Modification methylase HemK [Metarhizium album ARSEF 1941]KHO01522.1 Modification methylase HemK [Metarhizium album ARSEF 1941]